MLFGGLGEKFDDMSVSLQKLKKKIPPEADERPAKKSSRFDGLSEEDVKKNTLKDILEPGLDLVFVGINPSLMAAHTGHYYAGPGNHFYKLLCESKLIPEPITHESDDYLLNYKIGLTNIVARATRSSADLSRAEIKKGAMLVHEKLKRFRPKIAIFNGKCIYEEFAENYDKKSFRFGLQPQKVADTTLWVVPSSSARCANFPRMQDKLHFYTSLKVYLSYLKGEIEEVDPQEFRFDGRCKQPVPSTSKMWRRKGLSSFHGGGRIVNKETINMDTSEENILAVPQSNEFILTNSQSKSDSEKDSGISSTPSEDSERVTHSQCGQTKENILHEETNTKVKKTLRKRKGDEGKKQVETKKVNRITKERTETIDFVSMIKKRLSNKEKSSNENEDESSSKSDAKVGGLKFSNLKSNRSKQGFKIKTLDIVEDE